MLHRCFSWYVCRSTPKVMFPNPICQGFTFLLWILYSLHRRVVKTKQKCCIPPWDLDIASSYLDLIASSHWQPFGNNWSPQIGPQSILQGFLSLRVSGGPLRIDIVVVDLWQGDILDYKTWPKRPQPPALPKPGLLLRPLRPRHPEGWNA